MIVRRIVYSLGYRFRLHRPTLPGKPDIVLPGLGKIIEIKGCFWHQHKGCLDAHLPKSRTSYWKPKLARNVLRDANNLRALKKMGWRVLIVWECEVLGKPSALKTRLNRFLRQKTN